MGLRSLKGESEVVIIEGRILCQEGCSRKQLELFKRDSVNCGRVLAGCLGGFIKGNEYVR